MSLELGCPEMRVLLLNSIDEIDAEVEVDRLIAQNVLKLLADSRHFILTKEGEDHHKSAIEEYPFHDDVIADQVLQEFLCTFRSARRKIWLENVSSQMHLKGVFRMDRIDLVVH